MYRSFLEQLSNEDVISFTPPGFKYNIDVQFPRRCLPVCDICKKKSKTREHCRARQCHTALPWIETYVCISLDNSCIGNDGKILDGPFVAKTTKPIAFNLKGDVDPMTPVCASCKEKNYTRNYCRQKKKHRQLPYSTVHVITSLKQDDVLDQSDAVMIPGSRKRSKNNAGESIVVEYIADIPVGVTADDDAIIEKERKNIEDHYKPLFSPRAANNDNDVKYKAANEGEIGGEQVLRDAEAAKLDNIPLSRTFLLSISSKLHHFEWVDIDPTVVNHLQSCREINLHNANDLSNVDFLNGRDVHAIGRKIGEIDSPEMKCMKSVAAIDPCISNTAGISTAKARRLIANNGSIQPVLECQIVDSQMPQLGAQDMISHANLMNQMKVQRRTSRKGQSYQMAHINQMNQVGVSNQHRMQAGRSHGTNPFMTQPIMGEMPPYSMGVSGPEYTSFHETTQHEPRVQSAFVKNRMEIPGLEFDHMHY